MVHFICLRYVEFWVLTGVWERIFNILLRGTWNYKNSYNTVADILPSWKQMLKPHNYVFRLILTFLNANVRQEWHIFCINTMLYMSNLFADEEWLLVMMTCSFFLKHLMDLYLYVSYMSIYQMLHNNSYFSVYYLF